LQHWVDVCWNCCRSRRRRGVPPTAQEDTLISAPPGRVSSSGTDQQNQYGRRSSASGESGHSATSTPRESDYSALTGTSSRSGRDTASRLEPGSTVCFISCDGKIMGVRQSSAAFRELCLVPVTSAGSVQAGSSKRIQHFPTDSLFVVGSQVSFLPVYSNVLTTVQS
jgi:hypothetical protein